MFFQLFITMSNIYHLGWNLPASGQTFQLDWFSYFQEQRVTYCNLPLVVYMQESFIACTITYILPLRTLDSFRVQGWPVLLRGAVISFYPLYDSVYISRYYLLNTGTRWEHFSLRELDKTAECFSSINLLNFCSEWKHCYSHSTDAQGLRLKHLYITQ